jgi:hypothetical protein
MVPTSAGRLDDDKTLNILTAREAKTASLIPAMRRWPFRRRSDYVGSKAVKPHSSPSLVNLIRHDPSSDMIE